MPRTFFFFEKYKLHYYGIKVPSVKSTWTALAELCDLQKVNITLTCCCTEASPLRERENILDSLEHKLHPDVPQHRGFSQLG